MEVRYLTLGPFQENTYVLSDDSKECVIIDPGCFGSTEQQMLKELIESNGLKPVALLNTHCHVDHVAGNRFVYDTYGLSPVMHKSDLPVLASQETVSAMYGLPFEKSPEPKEFIEDGDNVSFGNTSLEVIYTPGHAPGHVVFYHKPQGILINGDVLFRGSIGRTDLPLGHHDTLINSIKTRLFTLPDETIVYCGHGPETTIGWEKKNNPFLS
jgi:hydroxyacylglutathione hydrolase